MSEQTMAQRLGLPMEISTTSPSGWWAHVHLTCSACGWQSFTSYDPVLERQQLLNAGFGHECPQGGARS